MAEKKNFTIENYNGTDYDTLYPETNSGQVLLDSTAQASTGLESGKTVSDALTRIATDGGAFQVGDTLTTARTNLGGKWLLCNGGFAADSEYPNLTNIYPTSHFNWKSDTSFSVASEYAYPDYIAASDSQVAFFNSYSSSGTERTYAFIVNNFSDPSSFVYLTAVSEALTPIKFVNNYWFTTFDVRQRVLKYCSGNITSSSSFSNSVAGTDEITVTDIFYDNGKYYGLESTNVLIWESLSQNPVTIATGGKQNTSTMIYKIPDGIAFSGLTTSTTATDWPFYVVTSENAIQTYTIPKTVYTTYNPDYICYFNGYYYAIDAKTIYRFASLSSADLAGGVILWRDKDNKRSMLPTITEDYMVFANGYYIGKDNQLKQWDNPIVTSANIFVQNGYFNAIVEDKSTSSATDMTLWKQPIADSMKLPSVSIGDNLYTYIKAKS